MILKRGMVADFKLDPTMGSETGKTRPCVVVTNDVYNARVPVVQVVPLTAWTEKKNRIVTNIEVVPEPGNGLTKRSLADCLQTRPVDRRIRLVAVRGLLKAELMLQIDEASAGVCAPLTPGARRINIGFTPWVAGGPIL